MRTHQRLHIPNSLLLSQHHTKDSAQLVPISVQKGNTPSDMQGSAWRAAKVGMFSASSSSLPRKAGSAGMPSIAERAAFPCAAFALKIYCPMCFWTHRSCLPSGVSGFWGTGLGMEGKMWIWDHAWASWQLGISGKPELLSSSAATFGLVLSKWHFASLKQWIIFFFFFYLGLSQVLCLIGQLGCISVSWHLCKIALHP